MVQLNSAAGLLALLEEDQQALQVHGLKGLLRCVDEHWAEVSGSVSRIEAFYEDDAFPQRELAALLAGKARLSRHAASRPQLRSVLIFTPAGVLPSRGAERCTHLCAWGGLPLRRHRALRVCADPRWCAPAV